MALKQADKSASIDPKLKHLLNCSRAMVAEIERKHGDVMKVLLTAGFEPKVARLLIQCALEDQNRENPRCARQIALLLNATAYKKLQCKGGAKAEQPKYKSVLASLKLTGSAVRVDAPLAHLSQKLFDRVLKAGGWVNGHAKAESVKWSKGTVRVIAMQDKGEINEFLKSRDAKAVWKIKSMENYFAKRSPDSDKKIAKKLLTHLRTAATDINRLRLAEMHQQRRLDILKEALSELKAKPQRVISDFVDLVITTDALDTVKCNKVNESIQPRKKA